MPKPFIMASLRRAGETGANCEADRRSFNFIEEDFNLMLHAKYKLHRYVSTSNVC